MLPPNPEIWSQIFQGSLCFTFPPPDPWFEPQHSVWQGSIHSSHWIFGIFNSEIEIFLEGKQVRHTMPHALIQKVVAQHTCPISQPKTRSESLAKTWAQKPGRHREYLESRRLLKFRGKRCCSDNLWAFQKTLQRQQNPCTSALS